MATPKKSVAKVVSKKQAPVPAKKKAATATKATAPAKKSASVPKVGAANKASQVKAAAPAKKAAIKSAPAKAPAAKKATASPAKAAAAKKSVAPKSSAPAKPSVAVKKSAPSAAPKKAAAAGKVMPPVAKKEAAKTAPVAKKTVPVPPAKPVPASKKPEARKVEPVAEQPIVKKETKAEKKAALKRTASAVQRVQARVAAAIPKPQPKPAPLPTLLPGREEKKSNVVIAHRRIAAKPKEEEVDNSLTMTEYQPEFKRSILDKEDKETGPTYRYSDEDLAEFKDLISNRLATARRELAYQQGLITHRDAAGTDDTENRFNNMEDGSGAMEREQLAQLASRQIQFINHLEKALIRIENKTYGICRVTGKLIDKARLRAVPHATLSIEAKNMMNTK